MEIASNDSSSSSSSNALDKPPPVIQDIDGYKSLARKYISTQLKRNGFSDIVRMLPGVTNPSDHIHEVLKEIADTLDEERRQQFDDMLNVLNMDDDNMKHTYDVIMYELFRDEINWGRIITFITFAAHMAVYCAKQEELRHKVPDIVLWTDKKMENLQSWIWDQGGLQAFIEHYDTKNWHVSLSSAIMVLGIGLAVVVSGLMTIKRRLM